MQFFPDLSTFVQLGPLRITWYAILIVSGAFVAYYFVQKDAKKAGYPAEILDDLFIGVLGFGIIGARIWYILFYDLSYYLSNPVKIITTWEGGLAIQGGLFAGALYVYFYTKRKRISFLRLGDCILPHVLFAQAVGRWGNFMNQEAFGEVVSEAFYRGWPSFIKNQMYINGAYRMPTFFFESVLNILGWVLIAFVFKKYGDNKRGNRVYAYLMWYGVTRFFVEGLRTDSLYLGESIRIAQLISIIFLIVGTMGMLGLFRKWFKKQPVILFDFDGTLADTEPMIMQTYGKLFKKYKPAFEFTEDIRHEVLGPTLQQIFKKYIPEKDTEALVMEYREINKELHYTMIKEIPGAVELLKYLKSKDYKIGIVSNKVKETLELGMQLLKMDDYVDVVIGSDEIPADKVKPDPYALFEAVKMLEGNFDNVVYVGDSVTDIKAGINAHAFTIGYGTVHTRIETLKQAQANAVVSDLLKIKEILEEGQVWTNDLT